MSTEERGSKVSAAKVATQFVSTYYERLKNEPLRMHLFYQEESQVQYVDGANAQGPVGGMQKIKEVIRQRGSEHWVLDLESGSVDAQPSKDGGVLLLVTGILTTQNQPPRQFVQTFFLASQASTNGTSASYYILNDTLRILDPVHPPPAAAAASTATPAAAPSAAATQPASARRPPAGAAPAAVDKAPASTSAAPADKKPASNGGTPPAPEAPAASAPRPAANPEPSSTNGSAAAPAPSPSSWVGVLLKAQPAQAPRPAKPAPRPSPPAHVAAAAAATGTEKAVEGASAVAAAAPAEEQTSAADAPASAKTAEASSVNAEEMPSTAVFVKNLEASMTEDDLKGAFAPYMVDGDVSAMLVAAHFDRGFAFVDLASQKAVAGAVSASRADGIRVQEKKLTVEPSKKPVRASGLKAMNEKRAGGPKSGSRGGRGGGKRSGRGDKDAGRESGTSSSSSPPASSTA